MTSSCAVSFVKYWYRLQLCNESQTLLNEVYNFDKSYNSKCWKSIEKLLRIVNLKAEQASRKSIHRIVKLISSVMKNEFIKGWNNCLFDNKRRDSSMGNKLKTI